MSWFFCFDTTWFLGFPVFPDFPDLDVRISGISGSGILNFSLPSQPARLWALIWYATWFFYVISCISGFFGSGCGNPDLLPSWHDPGVKPDPTVPHMWSQPGWAQRSLVPFAKCNIDTVEAGLTSIEMKQITRCFTRCLTRCSSLYFQGVCQMFRQN